MELPETERELTKAWDEFEVLEHPSPEQADAFVTSLLALSTEPALWTDALPLLSRHEHLDFAGIFRRLADALTHTKEAGVSFFYWAAAEAFVGRGEPQRLPEVAARFRLLGGTDYSADALAHFQEFLLAEGFEEETLGLAEHFMPIMRADEKLMPYAAAEHAGLIFELRVGRCLCGEPDPGSAPESLAKELRNGIEEEIHEEAALNAAKVITGQAEIPAWTHSDFAIFSMESLERAKAWQQYLRLCRTLMHVVRDAFRVQGLPPGRSFHGLISFYDAIQQRSDSRRKKGRAKGGSGNLLDFLRPSGIEERVVGSCRDLIGINRPRARMLLEAHETLLHAAARHQLISIKDVARTQEELDRLKSAISMDGQ